MTLSRDGNPEIYSMDLNARQPRRLTNTPMVTEASPSWSPDGSQIAYVSDRSGSPQVYVMGRSGGEGRRVSFTGNENVSPDWSPDGRIVCSSRRSGRYQIAIIDLAARSEVQITQGGVDHEYPSWARDGRHIVFTRTEGYASNVYRLDTVDPEAKPIRLTRLAGDWYAPSWSWK
jgi:TolB protein